MGAKLLFSKAEERIFLEEGDEDLTKDEAELVRQAVLIKVANPSLTER